MIRSYSEIISIPTFNERLEYLALYGVVAHQTFGSDRYLNQRFYQSKQWRDLRHQIIARDMGYDLGIVGYDIPGRILIHHMNPLKPRDLNEAISDALNPEYLICVSHNTHNAIHYGTFVKHSLPDLAERRPGDTILWRRLTGDNK